MYVLYSSIVCLINHWNYCRWGPWAENELIFDSFRILEACRIYMLNGDNVKKIKISFLSNICLTVPLLYCYQCFTWNIGSIRCYNIKYLALMYKGTIRSIKGWFLSLLRYFHSAYVLYASIKCLKETEIISFSTRRLQPQEFQRFTRQTMEAYRTYADWG